MPDFNSGLYINGAWRNGAGTSEVIDKFSLKPAWSVSVAGTEDVAEALDAAAAAHRAGPPNPNKRAEILMRAAVLIAEQRPAFQRLMAAEAGFPKSDADGEVTRCIETLTLSAMAARQMTGEMIPMEGAAAGQGRIGFTMRVPIGPVVAVTPFNSPLNTVTHKVAPAFAAGNPVILKPSSYTPGTAALLIQCLAEAGVPDGFLALIHGSGKIAQALIADERVRFITFTGSTEVGRAIQGVAGLRRTQMELGSIASTILCRDADLDAAMPKVVAASFRKAGQVCTSIQLLHVEREIVDEVTARLKAGAEALHVGNPAEAATEVGPMISAAAAERVEQWLDEAEKGGARFVLRGRREGAVLGPTILADVAPDLRVSCQEIFGPVVSVLPFDRFEDAVGRINASPYGLAAGVFTRDLGNVFKAIRGIDVGGLHINETSSSRIDLMPYGGVKDSGFGREGPAYAAHEMTEERLITMRM